MSVTHHIRLLTLVATVTWGLMAQAEEPKLAKLLERSPSPANAIAYMHLPSLKKLMSAANMPARISDNVDEIWLVSELDTASLRPRWEAGYGILHKEIVVDALATMVGGYVDTVAGQQVVWSPRQTYLLPLEDKRLGFLRPANRALLSQWINPGVNVTYSGYLVQESEQPEEYLSLMVAIELKDSFSPLPIEQRLADFSSLKAQQPKTVASILASVQGVSIIIGRRSLADCILAVEFEKSPASLRAYCQRVTRRNAGPQWHSCTGSVVLESQGRRQHAFVPRIDFGGFARRCSGYLQFVERSRKRREFAGQTNHTRNNHIGSDRLYHQALLRRSWSGHRTRAEI